MGDTAKDTRQRIVAFTETRDLVVKERVLRMLLFGSKETRTRAKAERLFGQGIEATRRDDYLRATALFKQAMNLYRMIPGTEEEEAACLKCLATILLTLDKLPESESSFRHALTLYQKIPGTKENQADCLYALAITLYRQGIPVDAEFIYRQSLVLYQALPGTELDQADCLYNLAIALSDQNKSTEAESVRRQALALYQTIPSTQHERARCLYNLTNTLHKLGKNAQAEPLYRQAITLYQTIPGTQQKQANCLNNLATTLDDLGKPAQAESLYYQALTLYQKIPGTEYEQATSTYSLATTLLSQGKLDPTEALYQDALKQAVSAALFNDEYRYQLTSPTKRRAWITNRAQPSMILAIALAGVLEEASLVAELVAKWRMVGSLAAIPAARNSDIFLITTMPDFTPEPEETLNRTPGPNLVLPHPRTTPLYQHPTIADRPRAHYR